MNEVVVATKDYPARYFIQGNVPQKDLSSVFPISLKDGDGIPTRNTT